MHGLLCLWDLGRRDSSVVLEKSNIDVVRSKGLGMVSGESLKPVEIVEKILAALHWFGVNP